MEQRGKREGPEGRFCTLSCISSCLSLFLFRQGIKRSFCCFLDIPSHNLAALPSLPP